MSEGVQSRSRNRPTGRRKIECEYQLLINSIRRYFPASESIVLFGASYSHAEILALLQARLDAARDVTRLQAELRYAVANERQRHARAHSVRAAIKKLVEGSYGAGSVHLTNFGFGRTIRRGP